MAFHDKACEQRYIGDKYAKKPNGAGPDPRNAAVVVLQWKQIKSLRAKLHGFCLTNLLVHLDVSHNRLSHLPDWLPTKCPQLRIVILVDNLFLSIKDFCTLSALRSLESLDFRDNPCYVSNRLVLLDKLLFKANNAAQSPTWLHDTASCVANVRREAHVDTSGQYALLSQKPARRVNGSAATRQRDMRVTNNEVRQRKVACALPRAHLFNDVPPFPVNVPYFKSLAFVNGEKVTVAQLEDLVRDRPMGRKQVGGNEAGATHVDAFDMVRSAQSLDNLHVVFNRMRKAPDGHASGWSGSQSKELRSAHNEDDVSLASSEETLEIECDEQHQGKKGAPLQKADVAHGSTDPIERAEEQQETLELWDELRTRLRSTEECGTEPLTWDTADAEMSEEAATSTMKEPLRDAINELENEVISQEFWEKVDFTNIHDPEEDLVLDALKTVKTLIASYRMREELNVDMTFAQTHRFQRYFDYEKVEQLCGNMSASKRSMLFAALRKDIFQGGWDGTGFDNMLKWLQLNGKMQEIRATEKSAVNLVAAKLEDETLINVASKAKRGIYPPQGRVLDVTVSDEWTHSPGRSTFHPTRRDRNFLPRCAPTSLREDKHLFTPVEKVNRKYFPLNPLVVRDLENLDKPPLPLDLDFEAKHIRDEARAFRNSVVNQPWLQRVTREKQRVENIYNVARRCDERLEAEKKRRAFSIQITGHAEPSELDKQLQQVVDFFGSDVAKRPSALTVCRKLQQQKDLENSFNKRLNRSFTGLYSEAEQEHLHLPE